MIPTDMSGLEQMIPHRCNCDDTSVLTGVRENKRLFLLSLSLRSFKELQAGHDEIHASRTLGL